jgi:hypothetical protein
MQRNEILQKKNGFSGFFFAACGFCQYFVHDGQSQALKFASRRQKTATN